MADTTQHISPFSPNTPYWIFNVYARTALTLDLVPTCREDNTPVTSCLLNGSDNQNWVLEGTESSFSIKNSMSGTYVGHAADTIPTGAVTVTANTNIVKFKLQGDSEKGYNILVDNQKPPLAIDLWGYSPENRANIAFWEPTDGPNQKWILVPVPNHQKYRPTYKSPIKTGGYFRIRSSDIIYSLSSHSQDADVTLQGTTVIVNQAWSIEPGIAGYRIKSLQKNLYLSGALGDSKLEANGAEFVFEGSPEKGYYIIPAGTPQYSLQILGGSGTHEGVKAELRAGRRRKWLLERY